MNKKANLIKRCHAKRTKRGAKSCQCLTRNKISPFYRNEISVAGGIIYALLFISIQPTHAQVFKTQQKALQEAFPNSDLIDRKVLFLTDEQVDQIQKLAKSKLESQIVTFYVGKKADAITGYAFFETNIVRTKPETFIVVLGPNAKIKHVEVLAFYEPFDYLPTSNWFDLFGGKILNSNLWPKRDIHNITGATLSVQAITQGVRKILAVYQVVIEQGEFE